MEHSGDLDRRNDDVKDVATLSRPAREAGPVFHALQRLTEEIDRLALSEQALRDDLVRVLGPQRTDRLSEAAKIDHEEQAPLANDLDVLYARVCAIRVSLVETIDRLHL